MRTPMSLARRLFLKLLGGAAVASTTNTSCAPNEEDDSSAADITADHYDYIVVGSGAGGGPLAANLARNGFRVLLVEAGDDPGNLDVRDVSPQNVLVGLDGLARITEFGMAKASGSSATLTGVLKGKCAYMAPEYVAGRALDARRDVLALGIVLWERLRGNPSSSVPPISRYCSSSRAVPSNRPRAWRRASTAGSTTSS